MLRKMPTLALPHRFWYVGFSYYFLATLELSVGIFSLPEELRICLILGGLFLISVTRSYFYFYCFPVSLNNDLRNVVVIIIIIGQSIMITWTDFLSNKYSTDTATGMSFHHM